MENKHVIAKEEVKRQLIELLKSATYTEKYCTSDGKPVTSGQRRIVDFGDVDCLAGYLVKNDVTIRERGEWVLEDGLYHCSRCGTTCPYDASGDIIEYWTCYTCPVCGADMGGGKDE